MTFESFNTDSLGSVTFVGSRRLCGPAAAVFAASAAGVAALLDVPVLVGCARGADAAIREAILDAVIFHASDFGRGRGSYARRTVAMLDAAAALSDPGLPAALAVAPLGACPAGLLPTALPGRAFCGLGSGSWAALALWLGRFDAPVFLLPAACPAHVAYAPELPADWSISARPSGHPCFPASSGWWGLDHAAGF